ncbi:putative peptidyl-prolyl cis-trans isomerase [Toxoplasma gondii MAS]|uniref:Putative peptidyl-prolyl cis-trans isomerase n=1 Tax=Toxoplasma gondii MAS TaxID=943118 RepID=A0A086QCD6_TOXGO|nr:putative peptidyl-prolyl cis-trans isomerase [Toxoplasma gondii MAS]
MSRGSCLQDSVRFVYKPIPAQTRRWAIQNRGCGPIRILHTFVLDDPFEDPAFLEDAPSSPVPLVEEVGSDDEELDEVLVLEKIEKKEADARKVTLEILGDLPDADAKPPDNVLFVAKLNPVTQDEDLQTVFSRWVGEGTTEELLEKNENAGK